MHAYKRDDLNNKYVHEQAKEAIQYLCISKESYDKIITAFPIRLYTPNYFIRIALGLLTIIAVLFSGLLLWLLSGASATSSIISLLIFIAILSYIFLEIFAGVKHFYNAGVDNILGVMVILFIGCALFIYDENIWFAGSLVLMIISLWLSIRFTDSFMAALSYCCCFVFIFLLYTKGGNITKATAPLVMILFSAIIYFVVKKIIQRSLFLYRHCLKAVTLLTLITFYASGNYFVIKELSNQIFSSGFSENNPIPFGWLFWTFTLLIPPVYIFYGIRKKDLLFIRTGLAITAATVFTIKYYYKILSPEITMLTGGIILITISYALIRYLKTPKHQFTSQDVYLLNKKIINAEALIIAETFTPHPVVKQPGLYEGGSGGGGGATGEF